MTHRYGMSAFGAGADPNVPQTEPECVARGYRWSSGQCWIGPPVPGAPLSEDLVYWWDTYWQFRVAVIGGGLALLGSAIYFATRKP